MHFSQSGDAFDQAVGVGASTIELSQIDDLIETFDLNLRLSVSVLFVI